MQDTDIYANFVLKGKSQEREGWQFQLNLAVQKVV